MAKKAKRTKDGDRVGANFPRKRGRPKKVETVLEFPGKNATNGSGDTQALQPSGDLRMELAADDLGEIVLPSPEDSQRVLKELALLQHRRYGANKRHEDLKAQTKTAGEKVKELDDQISERIRVATHESDLPLFNQDEAEVDVSRIQTEAEQPLPPIGVDEAVSVPSLTLPSQQTAPDSDDAPF